MATISTISQLNKIGERLRKNQGTEEDLRKLDEFRVSFEPAYQKVFHELTSMGLNPGGRPQKTTQSIVAKLERERTRLSRMQDIAGCRVEVENLTEQDRVVDELKTKFPSANVLDRRAKPSHGYRAVHLVVTIDRCPVEIQVRTSLQHSWASAAEKLSDVYHPQIKYGRGPEEIQRFLTEISDIVANIENQEVRCAKLHPLIENGPTIEDLAPAIIEQYDEGAHIVEQIKKHGGLKPYFEKMEADLTGMRENVNAMLKDLSERYTIHDKDRNQ
jgi:(p)ppGpp synthase/HD superfamily hydrolase